MSEGFISKLRPMFSWRVLRWVIRGMCVAVIAVYLHFYIYQEYWLLEPKEDPTGYQEKKDLEPAFTGWLSPPNEVLVSMDESSSTSKVVIHIQKFRTSSKSQGVVLYFHGNKGNLYKCRWEIEPFLAAGYDVWTMDYRSFGESSDGPLNELALVNDAEMFYKHVVTQQRVDEKDIVVWGRSFGSGIAASVAANHSPRLLVLETPYCSIPDTVRRTHWYLPLFLFRYRLPTDEYLDYVDCPVHLIHGTSDDKISHKSSVAIMDRHDRPNRPVKLHSIKGGEHNLRDTSTLKEFIAKLKKILTPKKTVSDPPVHVITPRS